MTATAGKNGAGRGVYAAAVVAAVVMALSACYSDSSDRLQGEMGLCFPSPNNWRLNPVVSWSINLGILLWASAGLFFLNKRYYFIQRADLLASSVFLLVTFSFPWLGKMLCSSTILLAINMICISIIFSCYKRHNTTQETFIIASLLSLGSTIQYACVLYMPLYVAAAIAAKSFSLRNIPAFVIGIIAPYWCLLGTGAASFASLQLPTMSNVLNGFAPAGEILTMTIATGMTAIAWLVLVFNNSIQLLKSNSYVRHFNTVFNIIGGGSLILMLCDFTNIMAYMSTFMMCMAIETAQATATSREGNGRTVAGIMGIVYGGFFIFTILMF